MRRYAIGLSDVDHFVHDVDVAIIGSGLAGLYAAYHLDPKLKCALFTKERMETSSSSLAQGGIATIAFLALGVPRALVLGLITTFAALIPAIGTAIVWAPIAAGLALTGHPGKAIFLCVFGLAVIGSVDNILRPWLTRSAHLELNSSVVLVAMLGGVSAFGAFGLFLGPLVVRLAVEALAIAREADLFGRRAPDHDDLDVE